MEQWELEARLAIEDTLACYVRFADTGRSDQLAALFTPDGTLTTDTGEARGRSEITAYLEHVKGDLAHAERAPGRIRHHLAPPRIELQPTEAAVTSYFLAVTGAGVDHWGVYRDRMVPVGDRWLFASRTAATEGTTPGGWAARRLSES